MSQAFVILHNIFAGIMGTCQIAPWGTFHKQCTLICFGQDCLHGLWNKYTYTQIIKTRVVAIKANKIVNNLNIEETYDKSFASVTDVSPSAGSNVTSESWAVNVDSVRVSSSSSSRRGLFNEVLRGVEIITFVTAGWETDGMLNSKLDTVFWTPGVYDVATFQFYGTSL